MDQKKIAAAALTIRSLTIDAIEAAKNGHPGLPMGMAELGSLIYGEVLSHDPTDPAWLNRDKFVLSAGHGSMLLYSLLYLSGYDLPLDELKRFRQLDSKTPGHPEFGHTAGVETTTGPLGQGFANAVGMAISERMAAARLNRPGHEIIDNYTYVLAGDGCMMEGISGEAASLAGHLGLGKLIAFYDSNKISIEGSTELAFTENVGSRFEAYDWQVLRGNAYDLPGILALIEKAKAEAGKPSLIILESVIGKGSPNKEGSEHVHGAPLGPDEAVLTKKALGLDPEKTFYVAPEALEYFAERKKDLAKARAEWNSRFESWKKSCPDAAAELEALRKSPVEAAAAAGWPEFAVGDSVATRSAGGKALNYAAKLLPALVGGSADLAPSNNSDIKDSASLTRGNFAGRNFHFGVREHAMGAIANGIATAGIFRPYTATFLVFSDYMRPALRLAALMNVPVIHIFTHDSIYVGEDGPTHQPVEHVESLRLIPNYLVLRPGDAQETVFAWKTALARTTGPTAIALTRQNLAVYEKPANWEQDAARGAYIVKKESGEHKLTIVATGSEITAALEAAEKSSQATGIRVVSMFAREIFLAQDEAFRSRILGNARIVTAEAGVSGAWGSLNAGTADQFALNRFGTSAPGAKAAAALGLDAAGLLKFIGS